MGNMLVTLSCGPTLEEAEFTEELCARSAQDQVDRVLRRFDWLSVGRGHGPSCKRGGDEALGRQLEQTWWCKYDPGSLGRRVKTSS